MANWAAHFTVEVDLDYERGRATFSVVTSDVVRYDHPDVFPPLADMLEAAAGQLMAAADAKRAESGRVGS